MCGIVGVISVDESVTSKLYNACLDQENRGQDSSGLITFYKNKEIIKARKEIKGPGFIDDVIESEASYRRISSDQLLRDYSGYLGVGHTRYSTTGSSKNASEVKNNAAPFRSAVGPSAAVLNGNVQNFKVGRKGEKSLEEQIYDNNIGIVTDSDSELVLRLFYSERERLRREKDVKGLDGIFGAVESMMDKMHGAYSVVIALPEGLLTFRDPKGTHPCAWAVRKDDEGKNVSYMVASETLAIDKANLATQNRYKVMGDVRPGEAILFTPEMDVHKKRLKKEKKAAYCYFEYVYFMNEGSSFENLNVNVTREGLGWELAKEYYDLSKADPKYSAFSPKIVERIEEKPYLIDNIDLVTYVPVSSLMIAQGLVKGLSAIHDLHHDEIPWVEKTLDKPRRTPRTFILGEGDERLEKLRRKLSGVIPYKVRGKRVVVVDDSLVRGATSKVIVDVYKEAGAEEVWLAEGSPPIGYPCGLGIDMASTKSLMYSRLGYDVNNVRAKTRADAVMYLSVDGTLDGIIGDSGKDKEFCTGCVNDYHAVPRIDTCLELRCDQRDEGIY